MKFPAHERFLMTTMLVAAAAGAWAAPPVPCRVDPFADAGPADSEALLRRRCGGDRINWHVETPRANPTDVGPSQVRSRLDTSTTETLGSGLKTSLRMSWAGLRTETEPGVRVEKATLAAGAQLRLADSWALQMNMGRDVAGVPRNRATLSSVWQPLPSGTLYAEWAGSGLSAGETEINRVGARWWLVPRRLSFDLGTAQRPGVPGWEDPRFAVTWDVSNLLR